MNVGERIKIIRKAAGLTQKELADMSGNVATVSIQQYERGVRRPRLDQIQAIADALEVPINLLLGLQPYPDFILTEKGYALITNAIYSHFGELPPVGDFRKMNKIGFYRLIISFIAAIDYDEKTNNIEIHYFVTDDSSTVLPVWYNSIKLSMSKLNVDGQQKALERVEELTEIPKYQRQEPENAGEATNTPLEGKDTVQDD